MRMSKNGKEGWVVDFTAASSHRNIKSQNKHYPDRKVDPSEHSELNMHLWCTLPLRYKLQTSFYFLCWLRSSSNIFLVKYTTRLSTLSPSPPCWKDNCRLAPYISSCSPFPDYLQLKYITYHIILNYVLVLRDSIKFNWILTSTWAVPCSTTADSIFCHTGHVTIFLSLPHRDFSSPYMPIV